ncbi:hypothetical protein EVAR_16315_1 [Eumeta japonica]|uniref:Uncharacterized protein n=1 Tax=Eumeta variegata TaxID=151549 RepID=A0A4C1VFN7_EUMVA|nr:hypothetical protein EVAR_16315_1 [Eumeta japonica]
MVRNTIRATIESENSTAKKKFIAIEWNVSKKLSTLENRHLDSDVIMRMYTVLLLAALVAVAYSSPVDDTQNTLYSENDETVFGSATNSNEGRSPRTKRGLLLLKKKLLLGALGLKAIKIGAVGLGVAGAFALKSKAGSYGSAQSSYGVSASYGYDK